MSDANAYVCGVLLNGGLLVPLPVALKLTDEEYAQVVEIAIPQLVAAYAAGYGAGYVAGAKDAGASVSGVVADYAANASASASEEHT